MAMRTITYAQAIKEAIEEGMRPDSTVILYGHRPALFGRYVILVIGIVIVSGIVWAAFRLSPLISRALSRTGINIVTRIMGLIMVAIGVEVIAGGLRVLFPAITG